MGRLRMTVAARRILLLGALTAVALPLAGASSRQVRTKSGVAMVLVPGGTFSMGDAAGARDEKPHRVTVAALYMDVYEVTQEEYSRVSGENPARWKNAKNPVEQIQWRSAAKYCNLRSAKDGLKPCYNERTWVCDQSADGYRLPTEAEWEWAARGGAATRYPFGNQPTELPRHAWFRDNAGGRPRPVGGKLPNAYGLYDMLGNVWEWCNDFYDVAYYAKSPADSPKGPASGDKRVVRGGCFKSRAGECRVAYRNNEQSAYSDVCFGFDIYGFRCVRTAPASR